MNNTITEDFHLQTHSEKTLASLLRGYVDLIEADGDQSAKAVAEGLRKILVVNQKAGEETSEPRQEWRVSDDQMFKIITTIQENPTEFLGGRYLGNSIINAAVRTGILIPIDMALEKTVTKQTQKSKPNKEATMITTNTPQKESWLDRITAAVRDLGEFDLAGIYTKIEASSTNLPTHYRAKVRQVLASHTNAFEKTASGQYRLKDLTVKE